MTRETLEHLNENVLIGFAKKRGKAWHFRQNLQGREPNHYDGPIPIDDVRRRIFDWQVVESSSVAAIFDDGSTQPVPNQKMLVRSDTRAVLGVHSARYQVHDFGKWLLENVSLLLDDELRIGSAGLLEGGKTAWVQVERPDNLKVADLEVRPHILATSSHDGKRPTLYKACYTIVVCDNTRAKALRESSPEIRIKHSARSLPKLIDARRILKIHFTESATDEFAREVEDLMLVKVSDAEFGKFLDEWSKSELHPRATGRRTSRRAQERVAQVSDVIQQLWREDARCEPFRGSAFGVLQTINTWRQHVNPVALGKDRVAAQYLDTISGRTESLDRAVLATLSQVVDWPARLKSALRTSDPAPNETTRIRASKTSSVPLSPRAWTFPRTLIRG
jgi:phage/plasmid-like protein (TIGR03299 family)